MQTPVDANNQPLNLFFNREHNFDRDISEMIGLVKGMLADGVLVGPEVEAAHRWFESHADVCSSWPADVISKRIRQVLSDGTISGEERRDLEELFSSLVRGDITTLTGIEAATSLPLDNPPPVVKFHGLTFVFTGMFAFGPRKDCIRFTENCGGACDSNVTNRTDYLVVGTFSSRDWAHSVYGRKLEKAMELRESGRRLAITSEDHWASSLPIQKADEVAFGDSPEPAKPKKKRQKRSTELIARFSLDATDKQVFAEGWVFAVPKAFRSALDIAFTERIITTKTTVDGKIEKTKHSEWLWTQGKEFVFTKGSVFYDTPLAYSLPWELAIQHFKMTLQIEDIVSSGEIILRVFRNADFDNPQIVRCTSAELVSLLRTGSMRTISAERVSRERDSV